MVSSVDISGSDRRLSSKACAVHEAGHLFASLTLDQSVLVDAVWIKRTSRGQWQGRVDRRRDRQQWESERQRCTRIEALVSLAGPVAETRWRLRGRWNAIFAAGSNAKIAIGMRHEAGDDYGRAVEHLEWLGADDLEAAFVEAWIEVEQVLHKQWPAIVRLGSLLKDRRRIEAAELFALPEVKALLAGADP